MDRAWPVYALIVLCACTRQGSETDPSHVALGASGIVRLAPQAQRDEPHAPPSPHVPRTNDLPGQQSDAETGAQRIAIGASVIDVRFDAAAFAASSSVLVDWVRAAGRAVADYFGAFPVPLVIVEVGASEGTAIGGGRAFSSAPPRVVISVGRKASRRQFDADWRLTHELVHLAFPDVAPRHHWIEEGLATYVEPQARARIGWLREQDVWREWIERLEQGQPRAGDRGLDRTPTWARTYWGGALFCFLADVTLREHTHNRAGLRQALRAIVRNGGRLGETWPLERALATGDDATGTRVLSELYERQRTEPVRVDLEAWWRRLGVRIDGGEVRFDDTAPLADVRRALILGD